MSGRLRKRPKKSPNSRSPQPSPQAQSLAGRIAALEQGQKVVIDAQNTNAEAFRDCLYALEARQWMIMRAMDDAAFDGVSVRTVAGTVDWDAYEQQYRKFLESQAPATAVTPEHPEDAVIFGG